MSAGQRLVRVARISLRAAILIVITLSSSHLIHEMSHGVAAVIEGRPVSAIGWVPFNGSLATQIQGCGDIPGVGVWCAPIFCDALVFGVTFVALSTRMIRSGVFRVLAVAIGLAGPALDTLAATAVSGVKKTDLAVARHLDPQFPAVSISATLAVTYILALVYRAFASNRARTPSAARS